MIATLAVLLFVTPIWAQARIRIPQSRHSTTVTGTIAYNHYKRYVVRARAGQSIVARVSSPTGKVVFAEDYEKQYFLDLVEDGDYYVEIMDLGPMTSYRLTVSITRTPR